MIDLQTKKRRLDAWDAPLTEEQRWEAYDKSKGIPWYTFKAWVEEEFGLTPGKNAIYEWQKWMRTQEGVRRMERAIASRTEIKHLASAGEIDDHTADAYMALANDAILSGAPEKAAKIVDAAVKINAASLRLKEQALQRERLDLQQQSVQLQREKFEAAEARLNACKGLASDESLSEEERLTKIKAIFGL
jgi:hypothetical protein